MSKVNKSFVIFKFKIIYHHICLELKRDISVSYFRNNLSHNCTALGLMTWLIFCFKMCAISKLFSVVGSSQVGTTMIKIGESAIKVEVKTNVKLQFEIMKQITKLADGVE